MSNRLFLFNLKGDKGIVKQFNIEIEVKELLQYITDTKYGERKWGLLIYTTFFSFLLKNRQPV